MKILNRIFNQETTLKNRSSKGIINYGKLSVAAAMIVTAGFLGACDAGQTEAQTPVETLRDVEDVSEDTNQLIGTTVTLNGEVEEILSPTTFVLEEEGTVFNDDKVLVVLDTVPDQPIVEDQDIQVVGTVRQLIVGELERDYDLTWDLDLKRKIEAEYSGVPTVIANFTKVL